MKIYILFLLIIANLFTAEAQIGIYTDLPSQLFHLDAAKNNNNTTPTSATQTDDVVITSNAFVGIGTATPSVKLELNGSLMIQDGYQKNGHVLVSTNNQGLAQWKQKKINKTAEFKISGTLTAQLNITDQLKGTVTLSNDEIGLATGTNTLIVPKGKYIIIINGDIVGIPEYGIITLRTSKGAYYTTYYSEWLAQATFLLDLTSSTYSANEPISFYYTPVSTKLGSTNYYYTEPPYTYPFFYILSILQL